ncbi:hypothetical protein HPB50_018109 [Hyalomma asiaticum]|uniref:Uncharacterized protein n=1 Tax=Hyalomma asiaticum TaxID=266040 RepID=A0ACB7RTY9_HYAAI|nr:hypothetical protein HPB50_018109 [Hyalomma asiaticum]
MASSSGTKPQKLPKVAKVKNKTPAEIQITAEQLLREAKERDLEILPPPPKQKISDPEELAEYQLRKRKSFEDDIRKNRTVISNWIKYAQWEESQKEIQRARSVYERALDVDHRNITLWLKYAEMEMKNRQVNHARNIWDRAVSILPRVKQLWYKYTYMEEMLGNIAGTRQVFERWMEWEPHEQAWQTYINFELRYKELDRARQIYERYILSCLAWDLLSLTFCALVIVHPDVRHWIKYAKFEEHNGYISNARRIYERAVEFFGEDYMDEKLFVAFAKFEENQREHDRVRVIYKYALEHIPKDKAQDLFKNYTIHEKKYGDRAGIEDVIVSKRKYQYEEQVKENPLNYDAWFDYLRLMESEGNVDSTRETYERAIANVPPSRLKRFWRRYIYLWINYALYEELEVGDVERTREVYRACLRLLPHKTFTFAKVWLLAAHFEVRQKNLPAARKLLYAELETILGDVERARAIFEIAISQPRLDMPEVIWKSYVDFEIEQEQYHLAARLYERLLERTQHVKVWISYAHFQLNYGGKDPVPLARTIFERANKELRNSAEKEERLMLLEAWADHGDEQSQESVAKQMPKKVKKRRRIVNEDGSEAGWEEYFDYIFPTDETAKPHLKLLEIAKKWKKQQQQHEDSDQQEDSIEDGLGDISRQEA